MKEQRERDHARHVVRAESAECERALRYRKQTYSNITLLLLLQMILIYTFLRSWLPYSVTHMTRKCRPRRCDSRVPSTGHQAPESPFIMNLVVIFACPCWSHYSYYSNFLQLH